MRRYCLLAPCLAFAACATPVPRPTPSAPSSPDLLSAVGSYFDPADGRGHLVILHEHRRSWWLLADRHLLSVQVERRGPGFVVHAVPSATDEKTDDERLPLEFVFHPGSPHEPRWRYQAGAWSGQQFLDPVAARIVRRGESVRLAALSEQEERAKNVFGRYVSALRTPTPERLHELTQDLDPQALAAMGGPERFLANELVQILDEVKERAPASERAWLARQHQLLSQPGRPAIWPASEDARLLALVSARYRSPHLLEISDGWLMKLDLRDESGRRGCQAGWAFPDPTGNSARELHTARAAEPGRVSRLPYGFYYLRESSGQDSSCQFRPVPGHAYAYENGFPFSLFIDADGRMVGAQLVGYMSVELFVAPGLSYDLLRAMLTATNEEAGRQAE